MSDTRSILSLLQALRRRRQGNRLAQAGVDWLVQALAVLAAAVAWNALMPSSWRIGSLWPILLIAGLAAWQALRVRPADPLWRVAASADDAARLHDEITSAYWFACHPEESSWVELHLDRAADTARGLSPEALVPLQRPRRLRAAAALAAALMLLWLAPVPRVFEGLDRRLADLDLGNAAEDALGPVAELQEAGAPLTPEQLAAEQRREQEMLAPLLEEQQPEGQDALPEEGEPETGEQPDPEGGQMEGDEEGQEGEQGEGEGEQSQVDNPEDLPADAEREASPDPSPSQQEGQGDSTEDTGAMLPGGDEVFLQEGGEDLEQQDMAEEELGHATREGGGEEQLEEGELTTLEVQLQREILAVPEEEPDPQPQEEEKEELVTKSESSLLDFRDVEGRSEFAVQELLQSESIPWRYRQLVLDYFKSLRERDNRPREQERR